MIGGETARNMYSTDSNKENFTELHLVGYTWKDIEILGKDSNNAFIKAMTAE
jgi:hypothetical protein